MSRNKIPALAKMAVLWSKLYYAFARVLVERLGEEKGKELLIECIRKYAELRGTSVAEHVLNNNLEHNARNFVLNYDAPFAEIQKACLAMFPEAELRPSPGTTFCPYKEIWEQLPLGRELSLIYCEEFHKAMWKTYHPKLRVRQDKIMTRGDEMCTFLTYMEGDEDNPVVIFDQK